MSGLSHLSQDQAGLFIESFTKRPGLGEKLAEPLLIAVAR
jgi:hypothetical protein